MTWRQEKNSWFLDKRRITKLGLEGDDRRYAVYVEGRYLGSEDTFNDARILALSGKAKPDAVREETDEPIPRFIQLTDEERRDWWIKSPVKVAEAWARDRVWASNAKEFIQKQEAKPKEKKEKRPSRDGLISVADIAKELGIEAGDARSILRKAKVEKPAAGWAGDAKWAEGIRATIKKGI